MYYLEDDVIGLRGLEMEDVYNGYGNWLNDSVVCEFNSHHRFPVVINEMEEFVKHCQRDDTRIVLAVELKQGKVHIGNISLQNINFIDSHAEIAFLFGNKEYWGRGYATKAARLLINHAFMELGLNRIYFGTSEENVGMQKIGEKLNFHRGGVRRQALYKHGHYVDIYDYDILRKEWALASQVEDK